MTFQITGGDQEQDGDFMFTRAKRQKTSAPAKEQPPPPPEPESEPAPKPTVKKAKGRPAANGRKRKSPSPPQQEEQEEAPVATSKRPLRRKRGSSPAAQEEELVVQKSRPMRRKTRSSVEAAVEDEQPTEPAAAAAPSRRTNGARAAKTADTRKPSGRPSRKKQAALPQVEDEVIEGYDDDVDVIQSSPRAVDTPMEKDPSATKIALPFSDTPINNRNKEFRKKGGAGAGGGRRSSMSNRGRRASSLIESGLSAMPHKEVDPSEFFKHIDAAIIETKRMNHLLQWCGERALSEKPQHGTTGTEAVLGGECYYGSVVLARTIWLIFL